MADALVSLVLEQLTSIVGRELQEELKLLKGVQKAAQKLRTDFETIKAVLDDAEKRRVKEADVQIWLGQLKQVCYDMEDVLDELRTEAIRKQQLKRAKGALWRIKKVRSLISSRIPWIWIWNYNIALKIKHVNERLAIVVNEKDRYNFKFTIGTIAKEFERPQTTSFVDVSNIRGRDHAKQTLIDRLLSEISQGKHNLPVTAIVGMGGIGKTTLTELAFNDENVKKHSKKRIWVCVSNPFNATNIARVIAEALDIEGRTSNLIALQSLLQKISKAIKSRKFLLIPDNVWNEDYEKWDLLRNSLANGA